MNDDGICERCRKTIGIHKLKVVESGAFEYVVCERCEKKITEDDLQNE